MKKIWLYMAGGGLALLLLLLLLFGMGSGRQDTKILFAPAKNLSFSVIVSVAGELDAARSTVLFSRVRGSMGKIIHLAADGNRVKQGAVLVRFDPTKFEDKVAQLKAKVGEYETLVNAHDQALSWEKIQAEREIKASDFAVRSAELDLRKLEKGDGPLELARLEGAAAEAKILLESSQGYLADLIKLSQKGYANPMEIAKAKKKMGETKQAYVRAMRQYKSYRLYVLPSQVEKARAGVAKAKMISNQTKKASVFRVGKAMAALANIRHKLATARHQLKVARGELAATVIRAPIPGIVVLPESYRGGERRKPRIGDTVWQNQPLVYLPDISRMIVKSQVREIDLHKVAVGKSVMVQVDAYPELKLSGQVTAIGVLAKRAGRSRGEKYFQLTISIQGEHPRLRPGMTARAQILCAKATDVLAVPVQSIFKETEGNFCYVRDGGYYRRRQVKLGAVNEDWAQIVRGLAAGEMVALSRPPREMVSGERLLAAKGAGN